MLSQICESFHCTPAEAVDLPTELTLRIMLLRAYAGTKREVEEATEKSPASKFAREWYGEVVEYLMEMREGGRRR